MATVEFSDLVRVLEYNDLLSDRDIDQLKQQIDKSIDPRKLMRMLVDRQKITRWQATQLLRGEQRLKIGKMILTDEVGPSNLGQIYQAWQTGLDRKVALLVLDDEFQNDQDLLERFGQRIGSFSSVQDGSLVRPLEIEKHDDPEHGDVVVMAMDHYEGTDLAEYVKQNGALTKFQTVNLVQQLTGLAESLHAEGEVHGELTPGSIVYDEEQGARVLCFDPTPGGDDAVDEMTEYFVSPQSVEDAANPAMDYFSIGRLGLFAMTGDTPDSDYIAEHKSPLVTLFSRMSTGDETQIDSPDKVNRLLDKWLELNAEEEPQVEDSAEGIGLSPEDYQQDGDIGSVQLNTNFDQSRMQGRSHLGGAATAAEDGAMAGEADSQDSVVAEPAKKRMSTGLLVGIIGGAMAAILLLSGGAAAGVWMLMNANDRTVAGTPQNLANSTTEIAVPRTSSDLEDVAASPGQAAKPATDPAQQNENAGDEATAAEPSQLVTSGIAKGVLDEPAADADSKPAAKQDDAPDQLAMVNADAAKVDVKDSSPDAAAAQKLKEDAAKAAQEKAKSEMQAKKAAGTDADKKAAEKKAGKDAASKDAAKQKQAKTQKVFQMAAAFDLPQLGTSLKTAEGYDQPKKLGRINLVPGEFFAIELQGGDSAFKKGTAYSLKEIAAEKRSWQVRLTPNVKNEKDTRTIGEFRIEDNDFIFQWAADAPKVGGATMFRNCLLALKTGTELHYVAMRNPLQIEPLILEERTFAGRSEAKIEDMPNVDFVFVEIMSPGPQFPKYTFEGGASFPAKGSSKMLIGEKSHEYVSVDIRSRGRGKVSLTAKAMLLLKETKPMSIPQQTGLEKMLLQVDNFRKVHQKTLDQIDKLERHEKEKNNVVGAKQVANLGVNHAKENDLRLKALDASYDQLANGTLPYRVYFQAGEYQVDLATPTGKPTPNANPK